MQSKQLHDINVIQGIFGDWLWKVTSLNDDSEIDAELQIHQVPRETDDYRLCGLYDKTPGNAEIYEVEYKPIEGYRVHEEIVKAYYDTTLEALGTGNPILMAGGHCTWAPGIVGAMSSYLGPDVTIGILWVDAHGDIKTEITSDNRLLAGMPLGTILGFGMERWRLAAGLVTPLDGNNVLISDYRVKTPEVMDDFKRAGIRTLDTEGFNDPVRWKAAVDEIADRVDALYLHIDIDILRHEYIPAFIFPTPGGNELDVVMNNIRTVMDTGKVYAFGVYNTLFDTEDPGQEINTLTGMKLIASGLENWKVYPSKD
jgi:arginase family enzyme